MKKYLFYLTGCMFFVASCSDDSKNTQQLQAHIIDSTVNVQVAQHNAQNAAKNDSILKALAVEKADTMEKALKGDGEKQNNKPAGNTNKIAPTTTSSVTPAQ